MASTAPGMSGVNPGIPADVPDAAPALRDLTFSIDAQADLAARWLGGRGYLPVGRLGGRVGLAI